MTKNTFSDTLIQWYDEYGRHDLPWQKNQTPYRVWVSEIMLQQTQVSTVIPYYLRFMRRFPNLKSLAIAPQDDVLAHWSGLGYYARARNLHHSAQIIHEQHHGRFPKTVEALTELPGIGRSTAGAILSFAMKQKAVILDGNVKRVLSRYYAIKEPLNETASIKALWFIATKLTPDKNTHNYNQAMMDLGATLCTRTKPQCTECPFSKACKAFLQNKATAYPVKITKKRRPIKTTRMLIIQNNKKEILLLKRPATGIWGGLWSFPESALDSDHTTWSNNNITLQLTKMNELTKITHQFTHFTLDIHPLVLQTQKPQKKIDSQTVRWYYLKSELPGGVPTPVTKIIKQLETIQ